MVIELLATVADHRAFDLKHVPSEHENIFAGSFVTCHLQLEERFYIIESPILDVSQIFLLYVRPTIF